MNIVFWNIEGLRKRTNVDFLKFINKFDIIAMYETWTENCLEINNYRKFEKNARKREGSRRGRMAGGLVMYLKNSIKNAQEINNKMEEVLWIKMNHKSVVLLIGVVYRQPDQSKYFNANFFQQMQEEIEDMKIKFPDAELIVGGDFNSRVGVETEIIEINVEPNAAGEGMQYYNLPDRKNKDIVQNTNGKKLIDLCKSCDLIISNGRTKGDELGEYTFISPQGKSCIDLILITPILFNMKYDLQVGERTESSHFPITVKLEDVNNIEQNEENCKKYVRYKWREDKKETFINRHKSEKVKYKKNKINQLLEKSDTNEVINEINMLIEYLGEEMKIKTKKSNKRDWFDLECKRKKEDLKKKLRKFRKQNIGIEEYLEHKKEYKKICNKKKDDFIKKKVNEIVSAAIEKKEKEFWSLISSSSGRTRSYKICNEIAPQTWIDYYKKLFDRDTEVRIQENVIGVVSDENLDKEIETYEIGNAIRNMRDNKACGIDGLPIEFFKNVIEDIEFAEIFKKLFNKLKNEKKWPKVWETGIICPIFKQKGKSNEPNNYRPITLLPVFSKIITKILSNRLKEWLEVKKKQSILQAGFRMKFTTVDNLMVLNTIVQRTLKKKRRKLYACFVDFEMAFDSINRDKLFYKLRKCGLSDNFVSIIECIYKNVICCVKMDNDYITECFTSRKGVRQGCQLSAILFNIYLSDLNEYIGEDCHSPCIKKYEVPFLQYADDLVILSESPIGLTRALRRLDQYCKEWDLAVNINKTKIIIFSKGNKISKKYKWYSDGKEIEIVNNYKYLGINLAQNGKWGIQIDEAIKKGKRLLGLVRKRMFQLKTNNNVKVMEKVFFSMIQPAMIYGCEVWGEDDKIERLDTVIKSLAKELLGVSRNVPGEAALGEIGWIKTKYIIKKRQILYYYQLKQCKERVLQRECLKEMKESVENNKSIFKVEEIWEENGKKRKMKRRLEEIIWNYQKKDWETEIKIKPTLELIGRLGYKKEGQEYVRLFDKEYRRVFTKFKLGNYVWESKKREDGTRVCCLCNGKEDYNHIIKDCIMLKEERDKIEFLANGEGDVNCVNSLNENEMKQLILFINYWNEMRKSLL